jgi:hypothetical protein
VCQDWLSDNWATENWSSYDWLSEERSSEDLSENWSPGFHLKICPLRFSHLKIGLSSVDRSSKEPKFKKRPSMDCSLVALSFSISLLRIHHHQVCCREDRLLLDLWFEDQLSEEGPSEDQLSEQWLSKLWSSEHWSSEHWSSEYWLSEYWFSEYWSS